MSQVALTEQEFIDLQRAFNEKVVIGDNIFMGSNPKENARFYTIVKDKQFDFVIDGLNVAHQKGGTLAQQAIMVLNMLSKRFGPDDFFLN